MSYKKWVLIAIFLFGSGLVFGLVTPAGASLPTEYITALEELSKILVPFKIYTVILIFMKNALSLLLSFIFSPILCLVPILALTLNGWIIALVSNTVIQQESIGFLLAGLLPHGIFELPALILGQAAALSFGTMAMLSLFRREGGKTLLSTSRQNLKYLIIAFILLLPAAIIETYVTPLLLK